MKRWQKPSLPPASDPMTPFEAAVIQMMHEVDRQVLLQEDQTQRIAELTEALTAQYKLIRRLEARLRELGAGK